MAGRLGLPAAGAVTLTVAGTNGKGSSATLASLIYREAGWRTGLYTSPHLRRYNERVAIDGREAEDAALCRAFEAVEAARDGVSLTYFEFGTLAALWLFREARVQVQVLEVGLGGRLDAVNLVDADCVLITGIGLDHVDWLGPDRESIAREKAGVFRGGRPAVSADPDPPAALAAQARALGAPLLQLGRDFRFTAGPADWCWQGQAARFDGLPPPGLAGAAQQRNAAGVLAAVEQLQSLRAVPAAAIRAALPKLRLPGRIERRGRYLFDVAHNAEAAQVLAEHLGRLPKGRTIWAVTGMLSDKPVESFAAALAPRVGGWLFAGLPPPRGLPGAELAARAAAAGVTGEGCIDVAHALERAQQQAAAGDVILVCGSFVTVAAALSLLESQGRLDG